MKCNQIDDEGIPEKLELLCNLDYFDFSGNRLKTVPRPIFELHNLIELDLGGNQICAVSGEIRVLRKLEVLYLGGNQLADIPPEFGLLQSLRLLNLCDNRLAAIPASLGGLRCLEGLSLHSNVLHTLPTEIVQLRRLKELSLRNNPLVRHFVRTLDWQVPSLLELAGRAVVFHRVDCGGADTLPDSLVDYIASAQHCANPLCCGVYFSSRIEHIKFKDFCGKFRMPLLQFLCSPSCDGHGAAGHADEDGDDDSGKLKKVLLG